MPNKRDDIDTGISKVPQAIEIFYSYSHKDEELRDNLETHLSGLKRQGVIAGWHDRRISAGSEWKDSIDEHLESACIILLLISADFIASDYCYEKEMGRAMARHAEGSACVIPIILRDCDWSGAPFSKLQALPKDAKPITSWENIDEAFKNVAIGLRGAIAEMASAGFHGLRSPGPGRSPGMEKASDRNRISADRGGVAFGDNAQGNIVVTGGVQGDFVGSDKNQAQGDRSVSAGKNDGKITTGDENMVINAKTQDQGTVIGRQEIHHHYHPLQSDISSSRNTEKSSSEVTPPMIPGTSAKRNVDQSANLTSRRTLIGVILTAVLAAVGTIVAAVINKWGGTNSTQTMFIGRAIDEKTEAKIRNAKVSLESESVPSVTYTDSEGVFSFPLSDPNKEIRIRIEADSYGHYDLRTTPSKNQGVQDVRLIPKTEKTSELYGTVLDQGERPLQGAFVTLDDIVGMKPVETSSEGTFRITDIPRTYDKMVRLRVVKEGYLPNPYTEDVVLGKSPPRIKLARKK